ncbi:hypothetical protein [Spirillospora albida]|uniref:hypothetical protein n=1 Tax=Spirillospora albida TaxID=58123 RepID=UPI0004BE8CAF|nr:hypothetical protein [Spirillospora albida]
MSVLSPTSPLILPWHTLRLAGRFALPLTLWFSLGELLRFGAMYGGYRLGEMKGAAAATAPVLTVGLLATITLAVAVAMVHCVREGLDIVQAREDDGDLAPWAVGNDESVAAAIGRAALPFVIFYLAWGMFGEDAREFANQAASRGLAEKGLEGQIQGIGMLLSLHRHIGLAIGLTAGFLAAKFLADFLLRTRFPRLGPAVAAVLEINFALFAVFTIDRVRREATDWLADREVWNRVDDVAGPVLDLWPPFQNAVLGALIWLVIAGVILGLDVADERIVLGRSLAARRIADAGGLHRTGSAREVLTRGLRAMWLPAWYGLRLVRRSGLLPFAVFALLFSALHVGEDAARRLVYELIGPHPVTWWVPRLPLIGYGTGLVFEILRICLLAAAFNLVMTRVTEQSAAKAVSPSAVSPAAAAPPATPPPPWRGAPYPEP